VVETFFYSFVGNGGTKQEAKRERAFPAGSHVLIADDFTNSGGTLFKGAEIIRGNADGKIKVAAFVTHFVAQYDRGTVAKFVDRLYSSGDEALIDTFTCTDSIPGIVSDLEHEVRARDQKMERLQVISLAPIIVEWVKEQTEILALTQLADEAHARGQAAVELLRTTKAMGSESNEIWKSTMWLKSIAEERDLLEPLKRALLKPLDGRFQEVDPEEGKVYRSAAELYFLEHLEEHHVLGLLSQKAVPREMAVKLNKAREELKEEETQMSINPKFDFDLKFGDMSFFYHGLESLIGAPRADIMETMRREHCEGKGATQIFSITNYNKLPTVPKLEWLLINDAEEGVKWLWNDPEARELSKELRSNDVKQGDPRVAANSHRQIRTMEELEEIMQRKNDELSRILNKHRGVESPIGNIDNMMHLNDMLLLIEEVLAACLYTGPMYIQYNKILRELLNGSSKEATDTVGGRFRTTMHAINSAILKLSKLTTPCVVYRGISGGRLPKDFQMQGGVEVGFMSTTTDRDVALTYAGAKERGKLAIVLEMKQGLANARGADLADLSQYPREREILWPPLTAIEVEETVIRKRVLVVRARPTCNTKSLTITEVINKRRVMVHEMLENMQLEIQRDLDVALQTGELSLFAECAIPTTEDKWVEEVAELRNKVAGIGIAAFKDLNENCKDYKGSGGEPLTKQPSDYFNETKNSLGDRRFRTAFEHALRMKLHAVQHVSELFKRTAYVRMDHSHETGEARLSLAGLSLRTILATPNGAHAFPIRARVFMRCLSDLKMVTTLELSNTMLDRQSAEMVLDALKMRDLDAIAGCKPIHTLGLLDNPDLDHDIALEFTKSLPNVRSFFRHEEDSPIFEKVGDVNPILLRRELELHPDLTSIAICKSGKARGAVSKMLKHGDNEPLGRVVGEALARGGCRITHLDLHLCSLGLSGLNSLVHCATPRCLHRLKRLNLGYNKLGPDGAKALALALKERPLEGRSALQALSLAGNFILDSGAHELRFLFHEAARYSDFEELDLRLNGLSRGEVSLLERLAGDGGGKRVLLQSNETVSSRGRDTLIPGWMKAYQLQSHQVGDPASREVSRPSSACPTSAAERVEAIPPVSTDDPSIPPLIVCGALNMDLITVCGDHVIGEGQLKSKVSGNDFSTAAGGKGLNQSMAAALLLKKLREMSTKASARLPTICLIGAVGKDGNGAALREELASAGVDTELLFEDSKHPTGVANIMNIPEEGSSHGVDTRMMVNVDGANKSLWQKHVMDAFAHLSDKHGVDGLRGGVLCLQCELELQTNLAALERAQAYGLTTVMRPGGTMMEDMLGESVEYLSLIDVFCAQDDEMIKLARVIEQKKPAWDEAKLAGYKNKMMQCVQCGYGGAEGDQNAGHGIQREDWCKELVALATAGGAIARMGVHYTIALLMKNSKAYGGFGGCVVVSRHRLSQVPLPAEWSDHNWRCHLYPTPDGDERMLVLETQPLHKTIDTTGSADAFIGPLALQLTSSVRDVFGLSNQIVNRLPLACALASLSLRHLGASTAYKETYVNSTETPKKIFNEGFLDVDGLVEAYITQYGRS